MLEITKNFDDIQCSSVIIISHEQLLNK